MAEFPNPLTIEFVTIEQHDELGPWIVVEDPENLPPGMSTQIATDAPNEPKTMVPVRSLKK